MAIIYLNANNIGDARNSGDTIYGAGGIEKAYVHDTARNVSVASTVEQAHFAGNIADYSFSYNSGRIFVFKDGSLLAAYNNSAGGSLCFKDGGVTTSVNPETGAISITGASGSSLLLTTTATHFTGATDTAHKSDIGGGSSPSPIQELTLQEAVAAYDAGSLPTLYLLSDGRIDLGNDTVRHIRDGLSKAKNLIDRCANDIADRPDFLPSYAVTDTAANVRAEYAPGGTFAAGNIISANNGPHNVYIRDTVSGVENGYVALEGLVPPLRPNGYSLEDTLANLANAGARETYKNASAIIVRDTPARFTDTKNPITAGEEKVLTDADQIVVRGTLQDAVENIDGLRTVMQEFGKLDAFHYEITSLGPISMGNGRTVADVKAELANANRILADPQTTYVGTNPSSTLTYKDIRFGLEDSMANLLGNPDVLAEATLGRVCVDTVANLAANETALGIGTSTTPVILGYVIQDTAENIARGRTEHPELFTNDRCDDVVPSNPVSEAITFVSGEVLTPSSMTDHAAISIDASAATGDVSMNLQRDVSVSLYDSTHKEGFRHVSLTGLGGDGNDILVGRNGGADGRIVLVGGKGADLLQAGGNGNILYAGAEATNGADTVAAGAINAGTLTTLFGSTATTTAIENALKGHNILDGKGYDRVELHASRADDTFLFQNGSGNSPSAHATISGFEVGRDTILLIDRASATLESSADSTFWAAARGNDAITLSPVSGSTNSYTLTIHWAKLAASGAVWDGDSLTGDTEITLTGVVTAGSGALTIDQLLAVDGGGGSGMAS